MDLVKNLSIRINNTFPDIELTVKETADLLTDAARDTVLQASFDGPFQDTLTKEEIGIISVALQWNFNPAIQKGVRLNA